MEVEIKELNKSQILDKDFIPQIFKNYDDKDEREEILKEVLEVAKKYSVVSKVKKSIQTCENEYNLQHMGNIFNILALGFDGTPEPTIDNYYNVITSDDDIASHIRFNLLTNKFEYWNKGKCREWRDKDDAWLLSYIEGKYKFYNLQKYELAKNKTEDKFAYHPIKDIIEEKQWDGIPRIDKFLSHIMKCEEDDYSRELSRMIFYGGINRLYKPGCKFDYMVILMGSQGCVDCDTEYFNGIEWKKISDYNYDDKVLIYDKDGSAKLEYPKCYIKQRADYLWHFETKYGINQCLSDEHNVYYITSKGNLYHKPFKEIRMNKKPFGGRFITAFDYQGKGINLTQDEIRLMVACFADGSIHSKQMQFHIKKTRKVERLVQLLQSCGINYNLKYNKNSEYYDIYFKPPILEKHFPNSWYNCSKEQFETIADEVMFWDGNSIKMNDYTTTNKKDADFVQFVFNSLGYYCSITTNDRRGRVRNINNKDYVTKSIDYIVHYSEEYLKTLNRTKSNEETFERYKTKDGYEYCFTVSTGMLVLRRNDCVFITGNCGKSTIVDWLNIKSDFYREVISIDGGKGIESITGGWICEFAELLAMIRAKEVESLKGYITRLNDTYRPAYGRNVISLKRQCIFIGTTNDFQFLIDKTGNRRYLPIEIHIKKGELYKHEQYVKNYILECWREAKYLLENNETYLVIPHKYNDIIEEHQSMATDDDPKIGVITDYLDNKDFGDKVCGQEIFVNCCNGLKKNYTPKDGREIAIILRRFPQWKRMNNPTDFEGFGRQKYWVKVQNPDEYDDTIKLFENDLS